MALVPVTLLSGSVSGVATMDINFSAFTANYVVIQIDLYNIVPATNGTSLLLRVSTDGTTFDSGSNNYSWFWGNQAGFTASSAGDTSATMVAGGGILNGTAQSTSGRLILFNPSSTSFQPQGRGDLVVPGSIVSDIDFSFTRLAAQATKGLRFLCGSGNITGSYIVTGIRK